MRAVSPIGLVWCGDDVEELSMHCHAIKRQISAATGLTFLNWCSNICISKIDVCWLYVNGAAWRGGRTHSWTHTLTQLDVPIAFRVFYEMYGMLLIHW